MRAVVDAAAEHLSRGLGGVRPGRRRARRVAARATSCAGPDGRSGPTHVRARRSDQHLPRRGTATATHDAHRGPPAAPARARPARRARGRRVRRVDAADREVDDTDRSVLRILAGQTAAALQNCALLDHSARLLARTTRQADDLARPPRRAAGHPGRAGRGAAARGARLRAPPHRPRAARQRHPVRAVRRACTSSWRARRSTDARLRTHLDTAKDLTRRAVEQLRSAIYALTTASSEARGPAVDAAQALGRAHARRAARRGAHRRQAGGAARRVRAVAVPHRGRGAVQHGRARRREPGGRAAGLLARRGAAHDLRRRRRAPRGGAPQPARGERRLPVRRAPRAGEHGRRGPASWAAR